MNSYGRGHTYLLMTIAIRTIQASDGYMVISSYTMRSTCNCRSLTGEFSSDFILRARSIHSLLLVFRSALADCKGRVAFRKRFLDVLEAQFDDDDDDDDESA